MVQQDEGKKNDIANLMKFDHDSQLVDPERFENMIRH